MEESSDNNVLDLAEQVAVDIRPRCYDVLAKRLAINTVEPIYFLLLEAMRIDSVELTVSPLWGALCRDAAMQLNLSRPKENRLSAEEIRTVTWIATSKILCNW